MPREVEPVNGNSAYKRLTTQSLFSGGGGMDLGFSAAGFSILCSTDSDEHSCRTLELNKGKKQYFRKSVVIQKDIQQLYAEDILRKANLSTSNIDLIIGGPPCQAFSVFGRRKGLDDPRGNLVWEYLRIVKDIKPQTFVFENVSGLKTIHNGSFYDDFIEALSLDGEYKVSAHSYDVASFGIPQFRSRVFFIGHRGGKEVPPMMPTHGAEDLFTEPYVTVNQALANMPKPGIDSELANHIGRNHSQRIIDRYRGLQFGERDPKTRINKLHPNRPSYTIIVGSNAGGGKGHVHPYDPREVTPRESARLQTFPDWWEFYGTGRHVIRQVGNAVPPLFAAILANHIKKHIFEIDSGLHYDDFIKILELDFLRIVNDYGLVQPQNTF
jgi:DNA (cytosine-5)-methyltransferase 1